MIEKPNTAKDRIILALDVDNLKEAEDLVKELKDYVGYFKIGLPLIVNYGFEAFRLLCEHGAKCYYDCKFHDIPHTVQKACISLVKNNVNFFNVHIQLRVQRLKLTDLRLRQFSGLRCYQVSDKKL